MRVWMQWDDAWFCPMDKISLQTNIKPPERCVSCDVLYTSGHLHRDDGFHGSFRKREMRNSHQVWRGCFSTSRSMVKNHWTLSWCFFKISRNGVYSHHTPEIIDEPHSLPPYLSSSRIRLTGRFLNPFPLSCQKKGEDVSNPYTVQFTQVIAPSPSLPCLTWYMPHPTHLQYSTLTASSGSKRKRNLKHTQMIVTAEARELVISWPHERRPKARFPRI